jgi:hypothetical protein
MRFKAFLIWVAILGLFVLFVSVSGVGGIVIDTIKAQRMEAEAKRNMSQVELLRVRTERLERFPLVLSSLTDTGLALAYALADRFLLVAVIIWLLKERREKAA